MNVPSFLKMSSLFPVKGDIVPASSKPRQITELQQKLKLPDAKNTRKIDAFFSKQKSSETSDLEVDEQSESRPSR